MQGAKGIHPARVDPAVEFGPLLGEEPAVRDIRLRTRQVDRAVRRVVVADHEHRAPAPEFLRPGEDRPREVELVADPAVVPGRGSRSCGTRGPKRRASARLHCSPLPVVLVQ